MYIYRHHSFGSVYIYIYTRNIIKGKITINTSTLHHTIKRRSNTISYNIQTNINTVFSARCKLRTACHLQGQLEPCACQRMSKRPHSSRDQKMRPPVFPVVIIYTGITMQTKNFSLNYMKQE